MNLNPSKLSVGSSKPSTGQQQLSKTTTPSFVTDVKGSFQLKEFNITNAFGINTTALVLYDTACSNSCEFNSLAARLCLQGTTLKLTVKFIIEEELIETTVAQLSVRHHKEQYFEALSVCPYVRENLYVVSDIIDVKSMQET